MTDYSIYLNGEEIEPEPDVYWIYAGSDLIWERKSGGGELIPDDTFSQYAFTKTGMLAPRTIRGESVFYDVDGQPIITQDFSEMVSEDEYTEFLWYDYPLYSMYKKADYIEFSDMKFSRRQFTPALTDTAAQWSSYNSSISKYLANNPTQLTDNGGGGLIPLSRPMGYIEGAASGVSNNSMLAYVRDGRLITDAGFVVLSVCGDRMITADSVYISTGSSAYGHITERDLEGNIIKEVVSGNQRLFSYIASSERPRRICKVGAYYSYYATKNGGQVLHITDNLGTLYNPSSFWDGIPENAFFYGGKYYLISEKGSIRYGDTPDEMDKLLTLQDEEWGFYKVNRPGAPGAYYLDRESGLLYVIGVSENQINGKSNYRILKLTLEA